MQKLMKLIGWPIKSEPLPEPDANLDITQFTFDSPAESTVEPGTRPMYRIGSRKSSEFFKAIDMSG